MRASIGIVQALVSPGTWIASCNSERNRSGVIPGRHSCRGFRRTVVSIMDSGAGSVAVSARPTLPKTCSTSGNALIIRSVCWSSSRAAVIEIPGIVVGM